MSHYQEIADLRLAVAGPSQFDMVQDAAARRQQGVVLDLPPIDLLAGHIAAHAAQMGDARAAYAYLDDLTLEVGRALRRAETGA